MNKANQLVIDKLSINCPQIVNNIKVFLLTEFKRAGKNKAVVGVSGGIDSSVVATLCVIALGKKNVVLLQLPYRGISSQGSERDSKELAEFLKVPRRNVLKFKINNIVDNYKQQLTPDLLRLGNIMARVRMIYLYDISKKINGLVVGTCNRSELLLGYETRYGDGACDLNPISSLYKNQIYQLAHYFNLPENILKKPPSAELWNGQTDENELGFSYDWVDPLLYFLIDKKMSSSMVSKKFGYKRSDILEILKKVNNNKFKQLLPPSF